MDKLTTTWRLKKLMDTLEDLEIDLHVSNDGHLCVRSYSLDEDTGDLSQSNEYFIIDREEKLMTKELPIYGGLELVEKLLMVVLK